MSTDTCPLTAAALLEHWQGHRRLTRRVLAAFPEDQLSSFSVGGMRPFAELAWELIRMAVPIAKGAASGTWAEFHGAKPASRYELLRLWDAQTPELDRVFAQIPPHRFAEVDAAFGQWQSANINTILYAIDNEIHHRAQGYVYLRALGIEPPQFWDRL